MRSRAAFLYEWLTAQMLEPPARADVVFEPYQTRYADGVVSNLAFCGAAQAGPLWHYPDLSAHVIFLAHVITRTLTEQMRQESRYLRSHARARAALKEVVEMPDLQADRLLRSIEQNQGALSHTLAKEMPILTRDGVWPAIVDAVAQAMQESNADMAAIAHFPPK